MYNLMLYNSRLHTCTANNVEYVLKTDHATLQIPSNMLSNTTEQAEQVAIQINKGSADRLSAGDRATVGTVR